MCEMATYAEMPVHVQHYVVDSDGTNFAGSAGPVGASHPDDFGPVFGVQQPVTDGAAPSQRDGGSLLFGLQHLAQLEPKPPRYVDQVGVSERIHATSEMLNNVN